MTDTYNVEYDNDEEIDAGGSNRGDQTGVLVDDLRGGGDERGVSDWRVPCQYLEGSQRGDAVGNHSNHRNDCQKCLQTHILTVGDKACKLHKDIIAVQGTCI